MASKSWKEDCILHPSKPKIDVEKLPREPSHWNGLEDEQAEQLRENEKERKLRPHYWEKRSDYHKQVGEGDI